MKARQVRRHLGSVLACASLSGALAASNYTLTDLGAGSASDLNNSGHVVGVTAVDQAFFYDGHASHFIPVELQTGKFPLIAPMGYAIAINDTDTVLDEGSYPSPSPLHVANRYQPAKGTAGSLLLWQYSPLGINNSGVIVGTANSGPDLDFIEGIVDLTPDAPDFDPDRFLHYDFDTFQLGYARPSSINDAGLVVGSASLQVGSATGPLHPRPNLVRACIFRPTKVEYIDPRDAGKTVVDPAVANGHLSDAYAVNAVGHIAGDMSLSAGSGLKRAFLYTGQGLEDLGTLGGTTSTAYDLNSSDQVVGTSTDSSGVTHGFLWQNGGMTDLNLLLPVGSGWVLQRASAINNRGDIVGSGTLDGRFHAFLLVAPDLPPTLSILQHPEGATLVPGQSYTLSVTAQGGGPLNYQWQHAGTNLPGAIRSSFVITSATTQDAGSYQVTVRDFAGNSLGASAEIVVLDMVLSGGNYRGMSVVGALGANYRIDFRGPAPGSAWAPLATLTLTNASQIFIDYDSPSNPVRIYRAVRLP